MPVLTDDSRQAIADILEVIAREGLPGPRDLDVALDAIEGSIEMKLDDLEPRTVIGDAQPAPDEHRKRMLDRWRKAFNGEIDWTARRTPDS